jgi:hypothetical protein
VEAILGQMEATLQSSELITYKEKLGQNFDSEYVDTFMGYRILKNIMAMALG